MKPGGDAHKIAMFKNGHLRLLMTLSGLQRFGIEEDSDTSWIVPSTLFADQIKQVIELIKKYEFCPSVFDDGKEAGDFIRRKPVGTANHRKAAFDDEDDGIDDEEEEELRFPTGGPTPMNKSDALKALKKARRRRRKDDTDAEDNGLTEEQLAARRDAKRVRELEKNRKIKSDLFIHDSDEEDDPEKDRIFFEQERKLREKSNITIMKELLGVGKEKAMQSRKRQSSAMSEVSDEGEEITLSARNKHPRTISVDSDDEVAEASRRSSSVTARDNILAEHGDDTTDTPMSSPHLRSSPTKRRRISSDDGSASPKLSAAEKGLEGDRAIPDDEDEDIVPVARPARQRVRAGFIADTSDEDDE